MEGQERSTDTESGVRKRGASQRGRKQKEQQYLFHAHRGSRATHGNSSFNIFNSCIQFSESQQREPKLAVQLRRRFHLASYTTKVRDS